VHRLVDMNSVCMMNCLILLLICSLVVMMMSITLSFTETGSPSILSRASSPTMMINSRHTRTFNTALFPTLLLLGMCVMILSIEVKQTLVTIRSTMPLSLSQISYRWMLICKASNHIYSFRPAALLSSSACSVNRIGLI